MKKIWFVDIDDKLYGPFTVAELRNFPGLTPDTLIWRKGLLTSIPLRHIPELQEIFEDSEPLNPGSESKPKQSKVLLTRTGAADEMALDLGGAPPSWLFALLMALIFLLLFMHFINSRFYNF